MQHEKRQPTSFSGYPIIDEEAKDSALVIIERDQLREQIASLKDELRQISTAIDELYRAWEPTK